MATAHRKTGEKERIAERRRQVFALRKAGASVRRIAEQMGLNYKLVHRDIQAELAYVTQELRDNSSAVRSMEMARCDDALVSIAPRVREGDLQAIETARKLWARITFLKGAEPSTKVEHSLSAEDVKLYLELKAATEVLKLPTSDAVSQFIQVLHEQAQKVKVE